MLKTMAYLKSDTSSSTNFDAVITSPGYITSNNWKKYCDFQTEHKSRIDLLRTECREVPKHTGTDRNMPPIPTGWTGTYQTAQDPKNLKNFKLETSCSFDAKRISEYEKRNLEFEKDCKGSCRLAAAKMLALMTLDIAYLKSFDVDWEVSIAALQGASEGEAADDDDDDETVDMDTSSWDVTDPTSVPFKDLKIPTKGKLPPHLLYACAILGTPEVRSQAVQKFLDRVSQRLEQLGLEHGTRSASAILTRDMTEEEYETYNSWAADSLSDTAGAGAGDSDTAGAGESDTGAGDRGDILAARKACAAARSPNKGRSAAAGASAVAGAAGAGVAGAADAAAASPPADRAGGDGAAGGGGEAVGGGSGAPRPGAAGGRRVKQVAKRVTAAPSGRQSIPTDRYRPPSPSASTRVVVAKKRKSVEVTAGPVEPVVVQAHAVPISAESGRAIIGQHEISRKFNKNHVSIKPVKTPPLPDMTLSSFWHAVSQRNNELIITCYYTVIIRNNELIITCYYSVIIRNNKIITSNNEFLLSSGFHGRVWLRCAVLQESFRCHSAPPYLRYCITVLLLTC